VERVLVQLLRRRDLDDGVQVHDRDPIGDVPHDGEVVGDEEVRQRELGLELLEQVDDLRLDRDIERGDRLVGDDEVRVEGKGARDADALALATGELVREAAGGVAGKPDRLEELTHAGIEASSPAEAVDPHRLADDPADAVARVERGEGVLEDDLHAAAEGAELAFTAVCDVLAVEDDPARSRFVKPQDRAPHSRLTAARLTHQTERLAAPDLERHVVDRLDVADMAIEDEAALDDLLVHLDNAISLCRGYESPGSAE
jgi:hypothetical protein